MSRGRLRLSDQDEEERSEQLTKALLSVMDSSTGGGDAIGNTASAIAPFADKVNLILQALFTVEGQVQDPATIDETTTEAEVQMTYRELRCWYVLMIISKCLRGERKIRAENSWTNDCISRIILYLRIIAIHKSEIVSSKWTSTDQGRLIIGLCALLEVWSELLHFMICQCNSL